MRPVSLMLWCSCLVLAAAGACAGTWRAENDARDLASPRAPVSPPKKLLLHRQM